MNANVIKSFVKKEFKQIIRDPSSILIAFILPLILLFLFGFGINFDTNTVKIGIVLEENTKETREITKSLLYTRYLNSFFYKTVKDASNALSSSKIRGFIVFPVDFTRKLKSNKSPHVQIITDGSEPNTAKFVSSYIQGAFSSYFGYKKFESGDNKKTREIEVIQRVWYNPALKSTYFILPGSLAIIMTLTGCVLTALGTGAPKGLMCAGQTQNTHSRGPGCATAETDGRSEPVRARSGPSRSRRGPDSEILIRFTLCENPQKSILSFSSAPFFCHDVCGIFFHKSGGTAAKSMRRRPQCRHARLSAASGAGNNKTPSRKGRGLAARNALFAQPITDMRRMEKTTKSMMRGVMPARVCVQDRRRAARQPTIVAAQLQMKPTTVPTPGMTQSTSGASA